MILNRRTQSPGCRYDTPVTETLNRGLVVGSADTLTQEQIQILAGAVGSAPAQTMESASGSCPLGGRSGVARMDVRGIGPVVIKPYVRGGLMEPVFRDRYFRVGILPGSGRSRARMEYDFLKLAQGAGVCVPDPVGYLVRGRVVYQCWLVTREIPRARTLAALSLADPGLAEDCMASLMVQVSLMVRSRMVHVDLHPGNVLITQERQAVIIDFDKAFITPRSRRHLTALYVKRWNRAVVRHHLPGFLSSRFQIEPV